MPTYDIQDASGEVILTLEGDAPPTEADIDEALGISARYGVEQDAAKGNFTAQSVLRQAAELKAEQAAIPSVEQRMATAAKPDLPQFRFTDLPGMNERTPLLGFGSPEEMRKKAIDDFAKLTIGDEYVHPVAGRIRKSGSFEYQVIDPNERSPEFFANVGEAIKSGQRGAVKSAAALGASMAGDQQTFSQITPQIQQDIGEVGRTLGATEKVAVPAALRMAGPIIGGATAPFTGPGALPIAGALSGLGEVLAERYEGREKVNPLEVGAAVLTGPVGINNLRTGVGMGRALLQGSGEGLAVSGANIGARKLDDIIQGREVEFTKDDAAQALLTTAFGGLARGAEKTVNKGMEVLNKTKEAPPMANVATQNAANIGGDTNALQASLNQVTTPSPAQQSASVFEQALQQQDQLAEVQKALELQETNKAIQRQLAEIDSAAKLRQSQEGADRLREQLALEQATAERAAIQQERQLADIQAEEVAFPELQENFPELSPQAQRMYDDYGRVTPGVLPMLASGAAGGIGGSAYGATQGETPEERMTNALRYGGIGLVGGPTLTALGQAAYRGLTRPRARAFTGVMEPQMLDDIVPVKPGSLGEAPAVFGGVQEGLPARGVPDIELFNLTQEIPGHPAGSTVSRNTLEAAGYTVPAPRPAEPQVASLSDELVEPTPRPFPADIEFLYRQNLPTREGGEKAVNYFQVDKTPENPRGLTVDDSVLMERGYSQEQISKMADDLIAGRGSPFIGGTNAGAIINPLSVIAAARKRLNARKVVEQAPANPPVNLPEVDSEQYIKQTAEKMIRDRDNPLQMRQTMAEDDSIIGQRFAMQSTLDSYNAMTPDEIRNLAANPSLSQNERIVAQVALRNKLVQAGEAVESAQLGLDLTNTFNSAATALAVARLLKSPDDYAKLLDDQIFAINGRNLSQADRGAVTQLARSRIAAEDAVEAARRAVIENFDDASESALKQAQLNLGKVEKDLALKETSLLPRKWGDAYSSLIKTGLLGARTISFGTVANLFQYGFDNAAESLATMLDAARVKTLGGKRTMMAANPLPSPESMKRSAEMFARNLTEVVTGSKAESFAEGIGSVGSRPIEDIKQGFGFGQPMAVKRESVIDPVTGNKVNVESVPVGDRAMRLLRGITGLPAAPIQRLISLSDNFVRQGRKVDLLREQGKLRGLTGNQLEQFIAAPPSEVEKLVDNIAARTVLQDDSILTQQLGKVSTMTSKALAKSSAMAKNKVEKELLNQMSQVARVAETTVLPFVRVPANAVDRIMTAAVPPYGIIKAGVQAARGDIRGVQTTIAEMALGGAVIGVGAWLWENGLISEPAVKDPKKRSIQYSEMGANKLNLSGAKRVWDSGKKEDGQFQDGDVVVDYPQISTIGGTLAFAVKAFANSDKPSSREPNKLKDAGSFYSEMLAGAPSVAMNLSPLMNASALLDTLANSDDPNKVGRWAFNTMRALVSPALPRTLDDLAAVKYGDMPELKASDSIVKSLENLIKYKTQQLDNKDIVWKRDIWGRKIDASRGLNDYYAAFVDPFKSSVLKKEPWEIEIAKAYKESGFNPDAYPSVPSRTVDLLGQSFKLDDTDAERIAAERGKLYRDNIQQIVNNPKWQRLKPQAKVLVLNKIYSAVNAQHGALVRQNPAFIEKYEDKVERKTTQRLAIEEAIN
jgi:hypothetical protein